jgi:hypothetical protein
MAARGLVGAPLPGTAKPSPVHTHTHTHNDLGVSLYLLFLVLLHQFLSGLESGGDLAMKAARAVLNQPDLFSIPTQVLPGMGPLPNNRARRLTERLTDQ